MTPRPIDEIRTALDANEWLRPNDVAVLLDVSRQTVIRLLNADPPKVRFKLKPGLGRHRVIHPDDVRRLLAEHDTVHGNNATS